MYLLTGYEHEGSQGAVQCKTIEGEPKVNMTRGVALEKQP